MPVVLTACEEGGYSYEYHHGTIGYGVFTYALAKEFRKAETAREMEVSFTELIERVNATMKTLRYDQISDVKGPKAVCNGPVLGSPPKTSSR
jgi:Caspase domain